jgi:uncharacterized RDD family membrane protein YckC
MSSQSGSNDKPGLFDDLPLRDQQGSVKSSTPEPAPPKPRTPESLQEEAAALFDTIEPKTEETKRPTAAAAAQVSLPKPATQPRRPSASAAAVTRPVWKPTVTLRTRITAGFIDLLVNVLVLVGVGFGLRLLDVTLDRGALLPFVVFALSFSFLYYVFPLAFWGRTPGMARTDIVAKSRDGRSLSFSQASRRWLGALLTLATFGIPLLVTASSGDLPADRLSDSQTFPAK